MKESAKRKKIVEVATRLFYDQGYNSTGMNQIVEEADVSRATTYKYFVSKRDILSAYISHAENEWFVALENFSSKIKDPQEKLLALFDFRAQEQFHTGYRGCHFAKVVAEVPKDDTAIFAQLSHEKSRLKTYIKALLLQIKLKNRTELDIDMIGEAIFLLFEGCTLVASLYKGEGPIKNARKIVTALL